VHFDWERRNDVLFFSNDVPDAQKGFARVIVGSPKHPYSEYLWAIPGLGVGYAEPIAIQLFEFFQGIIEDKNLSPNLYDGLKNLEILNAIDVSIEKKKTVAV